MKKFISSLIIFAFCQTTFANHQNSNNSLIPKDIYYRSLTLQVRNKADFLLSTPGNQSAISYSFNLAEPVYTVPLLNDMHSGIDNKYFYRSFWDRILFADGSSIDINGEKLPLTCIFIIGQDNRFADKELYSPLLPEFILKIYLVANDFSCQGPIKKGWPETGGKKETWDTYLYYEIRDPTIMLPTEATLRYRWNEYHVTFLNKGNP